jgi:hypothetical protein
LQFAEAPLSTDIIDVRVLVTTTSISGMASPNGFNQFIPDDTGLQFWVGSSSSTNVWSIDTTGNLIPVGPRDIGDASHPVHDLYVSNVHITGGSITGVSFTLDAIDNTVIGATTPVAGTFTALGATTSVALTGGAPVTYNEAGTAFATTATTIDSFPLATYRTAKYIVSVTNGSTYQSAEVLVTHDGANTYNSTYGVISSTGSQFATFTAAISGGNVLLQATGTGTGNVAKVQKIYIAV